MNLLKASGRWSLVPPAITVLLVCGLTVLCARDSGGPPSRFDGAESHLIIPNIDDDDGNGVADFKDAGVAGIGEDDLLEVIVDPGVALPDGALLSAEVPKAWTGLVRIFDVSAGGPARPLKGKLPLKPIPSGVAGTALAIEVGAFAGPGRPRDIEIGLRFETRDGTLVSRKTVTCRVAPFLISSCLDPADAVHVVRTKLTEAFADALEPLVQRAGSRLQVFHHPSLEEHDIWFQDATEIGYAAVGGRLMHVALQGNRGQGLDTLFANSVLAKGAGVIHEGRFRGRSAEWIDWYGNLEVSPPVEAGGRVFPHGRIYAGRQGTRAMHPDVIAFLEAQGAQGPILWLDTSWLLIGHVDEVVSWVPARCGAPYRMLVPSPRLALEILRQAEKDAPGGILNRGTRRPDTRKDEFVEVPVSTALGNRKLLADQDLVQGEIDAVRRTLQHELGIADRDIIEIPVLFGTSPGRFAGRYEALTTNMVNSLLVGETLIVPDPHGPLVNGRDVLLQAVKDRLEPLGNRVVAIDNFHPYHRYAGEVHCGTNATRRPR
jgi:protein-arginine deiminase